MATPQETIWNIKPHTKAKHEILRRYLGAWFPILAKYNGRIIYIDGFCGPGRYRDGEPGSPIIALDVARNHRQNMRAELVFYFIDERQDRIDHLEEEVDGIDRPSNYRLEVKCREFANELKEILDGLEARSLHLAPIFAFIDPFGFKGIPFDLVERLLRQDGCETFITFMIDSINRFLEHPEESVRNHIIEAFGTDECLRVGGSGEDRRVALRALYQKKLNTIAKFVRYFEMRDRNDEPIYYLFFASNHRLGHVKMKEAMWRVDPDGEFRFSDATNPYQTALFEIDNTPMLADTIYDQFRGRIRVRGIVVRMFVEDETAFLDKHKKLALAKLEAEGRLYVEDLKSDGKKRRAGSYPDDVIINFT